MRKFLVILYRWITAILGMLIFGTIGIILIYLSFGLLRNFFVRYVYAYGARLLLFIYGYKYQPVPLDRFPDKQVVYVINHNSYLDLLMLTGLGLPNTWYVISEVIFKFPHLVISTKAIGGFFIPQKKHPERRLKFFIRTTEFLKKSGKSLIVSAEGVREYVHGIQPFNKGIFHMAMAAGVPIVPLYLHIPEAANPYKGGYSKPGRVHLEIMDEVDTSDWELKTIWDEIAKVRQMYLNKFNELNNTNRQ